MIGRTTASATTLALCLALTACAGGGPAPQDHFYSLTPTVQVMPGTSTPVAATLLVTQPSTRGLTIGRELVFRSADRPGEVQRYDFHLWSEPPAAAIAAALIHAMRETRLFAFVIAPGQRARADYLLTSELQRLEHLPDATPPQVAVGFHLTLVDAYDRRPLFARDYQGTEPTGRAADPAAAAAAFNRLLGRLLGEAVRDLQGLRPRLRAGEGREP